MYKPTHQHKQNGFSLIEALVAFLILSVGMLGIASLQVTSLKAGSTAALRTVAVMKAQEIMERMRSNNTVLNIYSTTGAGADNGCDDYTGTATICTPAQLAAHDVFHWKKGLKDALPNNATTTGTIVYTPAAPPAAGDTWLMTRVVVTINWQERDSEAAAMLNMSYSTSSQMLCDISLTPVVAGQDPSC